MPNDKGLVELIMVYSCTMIIYSHYRFIFIASNDMHSDHSIATVFFHDCQMACRVKQFAAGIVRGMCLARSPHRQCLLLLRGWSYR